MNTIIESIKTRRSIRSFTDKEVTKEILQTIMDNALRAPSSKNSNPWFFVTVRDKQKEQIAQWIEEGSKAPGVINQPESAKTGKVAEGCFDSTIESVKAIREAPVLILIFNRAPLSGGRNYVVKAKDNGRGLYSYACEMISIGAAVQNILLSAHALGLGGLYVADAYPARMAIEKSLGSKAELVGSILIGYPGYSPDLREVHKNLVATWDETIKNGIPDENFTAKKFSSN